MAECKYIVTCTVTNQRKPDMPLAHAFDDQRQAEQFVNYLQRRVGVVNVVQVTALNCSDAADAVDEFKQTLMVYGYR